MLHVASFKWSGKCHRHPGYTPNGTEGAGAVKAGCPYCLQLWKIYEAEQTLIRETIAFCKLRMIQGARDGELLDFEGVRTNQQ